MSSIVVFNDEEAVSVILGNTNIGNKFPNELQAYGNDDDTITVLNLNKSTLDLEFDELVSIHFERFVDALGLPIGSTEEETVNNLNAIFVANDSAVGTPPTITSPFTINVIENEFINYFVTADRGVSYFWETPLPDGLSIRNGNDRNLIGVPANGVAGSPYTIDMTAVNYFGSDTKTLTITVIASGFTNAFSISFRRRDFLRGNASTSNPLYRPTNGSGASDAWSISLWFKPRSSLRNGQTILYFGGSSSQQGAVQIGYNGAVDKNNIYLRYGSETRFVELTTPVDSFPKRVWKQLIVTYDGGTTGSDPSEINDYYGRFKLFVDGTQVLTVNTNANDGYSGSIGTNVFRIGNDRENNTLRNRALIDEIALWNSDETANVASIYNGGVPIDLSALEIPSLSHWWRMGDEDTYPTISDNVGSVDLTMLNMVPSSIVNDVP